MANQFHRSALRLVKRSGGGHTITLRETDGAAFVSEPIADLPYSVTSYAKDEREGIAVGTLRLNIAALSLPEGVDLTEGRYRIVEATGQAAKFIDVELLEFDVKVAGGEPALYTVPLVRGQ